VMDWVKQKPAAPSVEGWYRVMPAGDSESIDGFTLYEFDDYEDWAYWTPAAPEEFEDFEGGYKGDWRTMHDEPSECIFAYAGPVLLPKPYKAEAA